MDWNRTESIVNDNAEPLFGRKHIIEHHRKGWPSASAGISPYSNVEHWNMCRISKTATKLLRIFRTSMKSSFTYIIYSHMFSTPSSMRAMLEQQQVPAWASPPSTWLCSLPSFHSDASRSFWGFLKVSTPQQVMPQRYCTGRYAENDYKTWDFGHIFSCVWHLVRTSRKTPKEEAFADLLTAVSLKSPRVRHFLQETPGPHHSKLRTG